MRWLIVIAGLLLSVACSEQNPSADGFRFGEPEFVKTDLRIKVVLVESEAEMRRIGPKVLPGRKLMAFYTLSSDGTCTIYKIDSRNRYLPEWDGHELNHCIYGEWHE